MKSQEKGFSPEPITPKTRESSRQEEDTLRNEFEIMQRLDFVFIKELGANSAEEYIAKVTSLKYSMAKHSGRKRET
ncbi:MAG: hypothetical protein WCQ96_01770 [Patescibacteria group bacterium]